MKSFPNFKGAAVEVWKCISNFIAYFTGHVITYLMLSLVSLNNHYVTRENHNFHNHCNFSNCHSILYVFSMSVDDTKEGSNSTVTRQIFQYVGSCSFWFRYKKTIGLQPTLDMLLFVTRFAASDGGKRTPLQETFLFWMFLKQPVGHNYCKEWLGSTV